MKIFLDEESVILDENEPFDLKGLERYSVEQYLVDKGLAKCSTRDCLPVIRAMGQLPQGTPGECLYHTLCNDAEAFVRRILPHLEGESLTPLEVDLSIAGIRLKGRIENVYADGLLHYRYANLKVKDRMRLWIHHLLLNFLSAEDYPCHGTLICKDAEFEYPSVEGSEKILGRLLEIYWEGLTRPLHLFPESSWAYVDHLGKGKGEEKALEYARAKWIGSDHNRGEGNDSYYQLCFGKTDPLDEEFRALAVEVFNPILSFETKVKK